MGGSPKQVNSGQASAANAGATAAAQASANLSGENLREQKQNFNYLFGDGTPGSTGSLTKFMDPTSLNVSAPTGNYATQYNNATNQLSNNYAMQRGALAQGFANKGFAAGMPSGFQADQDRKLASSEADTRGNLFAATTGQQYQDALNNFWNANNIASGQTAGARSGALQGSADAGKDYTDIYGTAGKQANPSSLPGAIIGGVGTAAGGALGNSALMCPARGARIRTKAGEVLVEHLRKGVEIYQSEGNYQALEADPVPVFAPCVTVITNNKKRTTVSSTHSFMAFRGGYRQANEALHQKIMMPKDHCVVMAVTPAGELEVFPLKVGGNHTYLCDGLWSLD